jgi:hypothetical protein
MDKATTLDQLNIMLELCDFGDEQLRAWAESEEAKEIPAETIREQFRLAATQRDAFATAIRAVMALDPSDKVFDEES